MYVLPIVLAALALATLLAPRFRVPQPLLVAAAGVGLGFLPGWDGIELSPELILVGFLPPLLYADAWETSWRDFRRWLRPILMLAIVLVVVTIAAVGFVAKWFMPNLPWAACFLLGAVVSPTDTVAVQAVMERLRLPRRLTAVVGGESLVNDATALVGVQIAAVVTLHGTFEVGYVALQFAWVAGAGILIGALVGMVFTFAHRLVRDTSLLFMLSLLSPYLAFSLAHVTGASGVLAVVVAGGVVSWRVNLIPVTARVELRATWQQLTFLLNGLCFLYVGLQSQKLWHQHRGDFDRAPMLLAGAAVAGAVILVRSLWCWPGAYLPLWFSRRLREREGGYPPPSGVLLVSWCGVRGAVSLAAALAVKVDRPNLPGVPNGEDIVACTVAVILLTLFLQGGTLLPLTKLLGVGEDGTTVKEMRRARERMLKAGIARLDAFCSENSCPVSVHRLREAMLDELASFHADDAAVRSLAQKRLAVSREVRAAVADAQEQSLLELRDSGGIDDQAYNRLLVELDLEQLGDPSAV
jgi:CPA1 family monovalent cation:H+ antiporter